MATAPLQITGPIESQPLPAESNAPLQITGPIESQPLPPKTFGEQASDAVSTAGDTFKGAFEGINQLVHAIAQKDNPDRMAPVRGYLKQNAGLDKKVDEAMARKDYPAAAGHLLTGVLNTIMPGFGAAMDESASDIANGDYGKAVGRAGALATMLLGPKAIAKVAPPLADAAGAVGTAVKDAAPDIATGVAKHWLGASNVDKVLGLADQIKAAYADAQAKRAGGTPAASAPSPLPPSRQLGASPLVTPPPADTSGIIKGWEPTILKPESASAPSRAPLLDQLTDYFKGQLSKTPGQQPTSVEGLPAEAPAGKNQIIMPPSGLKIGGNFGALEPNATAAEYSEGARLDKNAKMARYLNESGVTPDLFAKMLELPADAKGKLWDQASTGATAFHGEEVPAPNSPRSEGQVLFNLKRLAAQPESGGSPASSPAAPTGPLSYKATQNPDIAAALKEGARRVMPDGSTQVLQKVSSDDVVPEQNNKFFPAARARYQQAFQGRAMGLSEKDLTNPDTKPPLEGDYQPPTNRQAFRESFIQPELRRTASGEFTVHEGNHRFSAQVANAGGKADVLAWVPEPNLAQPKGAVVIQPSPELMKALQKKNAGSVAAQLAAEMAH